MRIQKILRIYENHENKKSVASSRDREFIEFHEILDNSLKIVKFLEFH